MPPETEVISCPACRHAVRVPADWLGQTVQCPECRATFTAPTRAGDRLTDPVLLTAPPGPGAKPARRPADLTLLVPAVALILLGGLSVLANGYTVLQIARDPAGYEKNLKAWAEDVSKALGQKAEGVDNVARWETHAALAGWGLVCGAASLHGGLSMARGRHYRAAKLGCVAAILNVANACCLPGTLFGLWGLMKLSGDEGREYFA